PSHARWRRVVGHGHSHRRAAAGSKPSASTSVPGSLRPMADRLDVVTVEVEDEGPIVIGMILRSETRRAIVSPARRQRRLVEGLHLGPGIGQEGDVHGWPGLTV